MDYKAEIRATNALLNKKWDHSINVTGIHKQYQEGGLSLLDLAAAMVNKIEFVLNKYSEKSDEYWEFYEIQGYFEWGKEDWEDAKPTINDYDNWLSELYTWGDHKKRLWVDAFGKHPK